MFQSENRTRESKARQERCQEMVATSGNLGCEKGQNKVRYVMCWWKKDSFCKCFSTVPRGIHEKH